MLTNGKQINNISNKTHHNQQVLFTTAEHPADGQSFNATILTAVRSLIFLVGTWKPTLSVIKQRMNLFLKA
jgi:hypothetical protein